MKEKCDGYIAKSTLDYRRGKRMQQLQGRISKKKQNRGFKFWD